MLRTNGFAGLVSLAVVLWHAPAVAQYSNITAPFNNVSNGYYEGIGVGFSGNIGNNVFFNFGGGAPPPFGAGGFGGGANFGGAIRGSGFNFNYNIVADSGYDASFSSVSPSITVPNGGTGAIFSGQQRPFVTGLVPLVGHFSPGIGTTMVDPTTISPLQERLSRLQQGEALRAAGDAAAPAADIAPPPPATSTAERGELSLSEIRARKQAVSSAKQQEIAAIIEAARLREEAGEPGQALIDYQRAAARAQGQQKAELQEKVRQLKGQLGR